MFITQTTSVQRHSDDSLIGAMVSNQYELLRAAQDAMSENNLEAFRDCIQQINLNEYINIGGGLESTEFLLSAVFIITIQQKNYSGAEMYVQAILDQHPNFNLPYKKGGSYSYLDFLTSCRELLICRLAIDSGRSTFDAADFEKLEKQIGHMAHLLGIEAMEVVDIFFHPDRDQLEAVVRDIDFVLDRSTAGSCLENS